jgi:hypothetical protein
LKRELRKQIKQDEFVSSLGLVVSWIREHRQEAQTIAVVAAVIVLGGAGLNYFRQQRTREAEKAMATALETFQAPIQSELPEGFERPAGPVFPTTREKFEKAAAAFEGIERRYGSQPTGRRAHYFAALCRAELGDVAGAETSLNGLAGSGGSDNLEAALARLAVADLKRREGKVDEAVEDYRRLTDDRALAVPRDHALMSLAATLEEAHRNPEARAAYQRLAEEFPASVYAPEARRRAEYLGAEVRG